MSQLPRESNANLRKDHTCMVIPGALLGIWLSGDFGEMTAYTKKDGTIVIFPKSPPDKPPSPKQIIQRLRFKLAQRNYMNLTKVERSQWEMLIMRNYLDLTGQNAYISLSLDPDDAKLETLNRRAGMSL